MGVRVLGAAVLLLLTGLSLGSVPVLGEPSGAAHTSPSCAVARAFLEVGEKALAREIYVEVLKQDPSSGCAQNGLAALNSTNPKPAVEDCARGQDYLDAGRNSDAITAFQEALKKNPDARCAVDGLEEAGPSRLSRGIDKVVGAAEAALSIAGVVALALFAVAMLGYVPLLRRAVRHLWVVGKIIGPRLTIEDVQDEAAEGKPGKAVAARIKERLRRMRDEAAAAAEFDYHLDLSAPREEFADLISENGGLKNSLDKASDVSDQTKIVAALLNLAYAILPIPRLAISATLEPPARSGASATLLLEENGRLEAATTLRRPPPAWGAPGAADYSELADPAAVWVQYEVARVLDGGAVEPDGAESYAAMREGLDHYARENVKQARQCYKAALRLDPRNWAAYVNLAATEARLAENADRGIEISKEGIELMEAEAPR